MAIIDVVKCTMGSKQLVSKFPSDDLRLGTQLVVYPGQVAFFVKGGQVFDTFESGTYTLSSSNIPLLNKIINIPFGGESPFKAEVWFVNLLVLMDSKWGTATPLQIEDPKYEVIVPLRAYGQYGFKISNPRMFLESIVGNSASFSVDTLQKYFKGRILSQLTNIISDKLVRDNLSILNINSHLNSISDFCLERIAPSFARYGLVLQEFDVMAISVKEDDPSFQKLKDAKDLAARLKITGRDVYQMERSFDVLGSAASNDSGSMGGIMGAGIGLGIGANMGNQIGNVMNTYSASVPPPIPQTAMYYLVLNGGQAGPYDAHTIVESVRNGKISAETLIWKQGMPNWSKISQLSEFSSMFNCPPPMPPIL